MVPVLILPILSFLVFHLIFTKFGAGLGLKFSNYQIDYSFLPYADLGNTHRVSFTARF